MSWCGRLPRDVGVIVVAAGRGRRMGEEMPKQFLPLAGVPVLLRALRPFVSHPDVTETVVVLPATIAANPPEWLAGLRDGTLTLVPGGQERADSVAAGLGALSGACRLVLVHDGARPLVEVETVDRVIAAARAHGAAIAAVPLADTLKRVDERSDHRRIAETVSRRGLWRAQTPQGFLREVLEAAHATRDDESGPPTDDAEMVERLGTPVHIVPGSPRNLKITSPDDLAVAEALLEADA
jgi:2-C-methyl-D-erythritol 4-phosphate cytidylyltransferase